MKLGPVFHLYSGKYFIKQWSTKNLEADYLYHIHFSADIRHNAKQFASEHISHQTWPSFQLLFYFTPILAV